MSDMNILILGKLNVAESITELNAQISKLKLDPLLLTATFDPVAVSNINKQLQGMTQNIVQQGTAYKQVGSQLDSVSKRIKINEDGTKELLDTTKKYTLAVGETKTELIKASGVIETTTSNYKKQNEMMKTRVGVYDALKGQQVTEVQLTQTLNQLYGEREIRAISLDRVTGRWSATLAESSTQNRVLKGTLDTTTGALHKQSEALQQVRNRNLGFFQELGTAIKRIPVWMLGMTMFYQSLRFFTGGMKYIADLNKVLSEVSIVTNRSQESVAALGKEYQKLAVDMAVSTKQIAEASVTFYRQGLSQVEVMDRVRIATQLAKIANVDFAASAEIITSMTNALGVTAIRAADAIIAVGDATATSAQELGTAMQKVSGTAGALSIDLEYVIAQLATVSARTREAPESIGNFLKTMYQRIVNLRSGGFDEEDGASINDVAKAFSSIGVAIVDISGNFRDFQTVIDEVGGKWSTLDTRTQSYIATAAAGKMYAPCYSNVA